MTRKIITYKTIRNKKNTQDILQDVHQDIYVDFNSHGVGERIESFVTEMDHYSYKLSVYHYLVEEYDDYMSLSHYIHLYGHFAALNKETLTINFYTPHDTSVEKLLYRVQKLTAKLDALIAIYQYDVSFIVDYDFNANGLDFPNRNNTLLRWTKRHAPLASIV